MYPLHKLLLCTQYYANFNYYITNTLHEYIAWECKHILT